LCIPRTGIIALSLGAFLLVDKPTQDGEIRQVQVNRAISNAAVVYLLQVHIFLPKWSQISFVRVPLVGRIGKNTVLVLYK
jgi:hypothetical protein